MGSGSLTDYYPPAIVDRYYILSLAFIAPLAAWVLVSAAEVVGNRIAWRPASQAALIIPWIIVAVFGVNRFISNQSYMGQIYRAGEVKAFRLARDDLSKIDPDRAIYISRYFHQRLASIFKNPTERAEHWLGSELSSEELLSIIRKKDGFFYLTLDRDADNDPVVVALLRLEEAGKISLTPAGKGRYVTAADRWSEVREALDPLVRVYADEAYQAPEGDIWRATRAISVRPLKGEIVSSAASSETAEILSPWLALTETVEVSAAGDLLAKPQSESGKFAYFQLFDNSSYYSPPELPVSLRPACGVWVTVTVRAGNGPNQVTLHIDEYRGVQLSQQDSREFTFMVEIKSVV